MYRRNREDLEKFIKKPYMGIVDEIMDLYDTIDNLQHKVNCLEDENKNLNENLKSVKDNPSMKLANAIDEFISNVSVPRWELPNLMKEELEKHLKVSVETDGYHDYYSRDHYHKSTAEVNWE